MGGVGRGQGVSAPYMAAYLAPLSQPTSLHRLLLCARLGPARTAPPAKLPTISILYNNPVFLLFLLSAILPYLLSDGAAFIY